MKNTLLYFRRLLRALGGISRRAELILLCGLPVVIGAFLALLPEFIYINGHFHDYALRIYPYYFEHVMMTLLIVVTGALLFDLVEKYYGGA